MRRIFHGLSDEFPNFCPEIVKFDQAMPSVTAAHLRDLRKVSLRIMIIVVLVPLLKTKRIVTYHVV